MAYNSQSRFAYGGILAVPRFAVCAHGAEMEGF